jgi:hypothetical protein
MPTPTVVLDTVQDAELERTSTMVAYQRTGYVDNIDVADLPDPEALLKVLPYLPQMQTPLSVAWPTMKLQNIRVRPDTAKVRRVRFWLTYQNIPFNAAPTAYMIRDRTFARRKQTFFIPGTREPVMVGFTTDPAAATQMSLFPVPVLFEVDVSVRSMQLSVVMYGRPQGGSADYVNYVNNDPWPVGDFQFNQNQTSTPGSGIELESATQFAKGFWKLQSYSTEFDRNAGMTMIQSEAVTQVLEDWSEFAMRRNEKSGTYDFCALSDATRIAQLSIAVSKEYNQGILYPTGAETHYGLVRFGPYPMTNFVDLFGF